MQILSPLHKVPPWSSSATHLLPLPPPPRPPCYRGDWPVNWNQRSSAEETTKGRLTEDRGHQVKEEEFTDMQVTTSTSATNAAFNILLKIMDFFFAEQSAYCMWGNIPKKNKEHKVAVGFTQLNGQLRGSFFIWGILCTTLILTFLIWAHNSVRSKKKELNRLPVKRNRCSSPSIVGGPAPHWSKMKEEVDLDHFAGPPWNLLDRFRQNDLLRSQKSQKSREISHHFI